MIELTTQQWVIVGLSTIGIGMCAYYLVKAFKKDEEDVTKVEVEIPEEVIPKIVSPIIYPKEEPKEVIPGIKPNIQKDVPKEYPFEIYN